MVIDKIYLVLWYWYLIVAILGTIRIICRLFQMASGNIRYWLMKIKMHRYVILTGDYVRGNDIGLGSVIGCRLWSLGNLRRHTY